MRTPSTWRSGVGAIAVSFQLITPGFVSAQITDSFADTLYIQPANIPQGKFDGGDTIWVGLGIVNTFPVGGMSFRIELPDTTRVVPFYSFDPGSGAFFVPTRLVDRGLPYNKPQATSSAAIRDPDTTDVVTGLLVDFDGIAYVQPGSGSLLELAFRAKPGIQVGDEATIRVRDRLAYPLDPRNNLTDSSNTQAVYPRLRDGVLHFVAGPVLIDVATDTGNDTLYVGQPGTIVFSLDANGNQVQGVQWLYFLNFTGVNWIGVLSDGSDLNPLNNVVPSPAAIGAFATLAFNSGIGATPSNPDTLLYGMVSFGGPFTSSEELFRLNIAPTGPGSVNFKPVRAPDFLTGDAFGVQDPSGGDLLNNATTETIWSVVKPHPVLINIGTSTGNDTLFVGEPGSIIFSLDANGNSVQGVVWAYFMNFSGGNWIGVLKDTTAPFVDNVVASPTAVSVFATLAFNNGYGENPTPVDSFLYGMVSFAGPFTSSGELFRLNVTPSGPGSVDFVPIESPNFIPPACCFGAQDPNGGDISDDSKTETIWAVVRPNEPPDCSSATADSAIVVFGNPATGTLSGIDADASPAPLTFVLISATNSNATGPNNPISVVGNTWTQNTSNANQDDVGHWTLVFKAYDGLDQSQSTCQVEYEVIAQVPVVCFGFGCIEDVLTGSTVCVPLGIDNIDPCKLLGGFDLLFTYDASVLTFQGLDLTGSVLGAAGWEYMTYRIVSTNPAKVRIVAIADMNNSNHHPNSLCIDGLLALVCFKVTSDQNAGCQSALIQFCWDDCGDNTASDPTGNLLYIITNPSGSTPYAGGDPAAGIRGGGIIANSCHIDYQLADFTGGIHGPAGFPCDNPDPTKPDPVQCLYFVNGKIKIICPGKIDDRGDLNLNALAYEIADAVLYSNYFIKGPSVFTINLPGQTAASDVNADGTPLTVADLVYLIRVITGDALPISGDLLGGGPKVAPVGTIDVTSVQQGANVSVSAKSEFDMGAGLFVFNYSGSEIANVQAVGRASDMKVMWEATNGQLKVLVLPNMNADRVERQLVSAGTGPILNITTHGATVELVNVEAASFMGGQLEATMEAKILPTTFALKQNFPNPFNPSTSLAIDFPTASEYKLTIYNIAGQVVKTFSGQAEAGTTLVKWDATDQRGAQVATGVYFYSVEASTFKDVRKMLLMK